jgi:hypothetical protein
MLAAGAAILAEGFTQSLSFRQRDGPPGPAMHVPRTFISAKVLPARLDANAGASVQAERHPNIARPLRLGARISVPPSRRCFEGEFASVTRSYAGKGVARSAW